MGSVVSSISPGQRVTEHVRSDRETMNNASDSRVEESECDEEFHDTIDEYTARLKSKEDEMEQFKKELQTKREQRREILDRHKSEKEELIKSLDRERKAKLEAYDNNKLLRELLIQNNIHIPEDLQSAKETMEITETLIKMKEEFELLKANNNRLRRDLAESNKTLQNAYSDIADLNTQHIESLKQITALKEVVTVSKTMIKLREEQLDQLKIKLNDIERSLADRETNMLSTDLRQEYERQLQNIRTLRGLYEERARLSEVTRQGLIREVEEQKRLKQAEIDKCKELLAKVADLEERVDELLDKMENKNSQIALCQGETRDLKAEMSVVNKLFSQVLLGYKTKQDLDKLVHRLEENHGLLTHMAEKENGSEASSALPKLLLQLVSQVEEVEEKKDDSTSENISNRENNSPDRHDNQTTTAISAEEIVQYLPKVWRVLMELLSQQNSPEEDLPDKVTTCYKTVETQNGPVLVPSVSQTYIRLKDLIIEKLSLIKEVNRMKQLNTHLETRLEEQERKLSLVTTELSKTWHVVGRLRRHHHQLHTHEKILKYELQQKRKLLNELKEELEYCREKWEQAREKNTQSERDLKKLRTEFSNRKAKTNSASFNNSAESGYSDERASDDSSESNDESEYVAGLLPRTKKKNKKSFETVLDSSTDFNLVAEREDPASDMLDVADLPLDALDGDENHQLCSVDASGSEIKKTREQTEDEEEFCNTDSECNADNFCSNLKVEKEAANENDTKTREAICVTSLENKPAQNDINAVTIDPAAILESIRQQNERLYKKDKKLEELEKSSSTLLTKAKNTAAISKEIDNTLNHLLNRPDPNRDTLQPSTSGTNTEEVNVDRNNDREDHAIEYSNNELDSILRENENIAICATTKDNLKFSGCTVSKNIETINNKTHELQVNSTSNNDVMNSTPPSEEINNIQESNFQTILNNVKQQTERLAKKDERFKHLEAGCSNIVSNIKDTLNLGDEMLQKLDDLHDKHQESTDDVNSQKENESTSEDESQPSTSSEIDHEARFAARDLRLKMLEEQTKSLVNKVNKTTTKGVKIHYKLQELHNIYGSESSRSGTPENEDSKSNENESDE